MWYWVRTPWDNGQQPHPTIPQAFTFMRAGRRRISAQDVDTCGTAPIANR